VWISLACGPRRSPSLPSGKHGGPSQVWKPCDRLCRGRPRTTSEAELTRELVDLLRPGMLVLADRGPYGLNLLEQAADTGDDLLFRAKSTLSPHMSGPYPMGPGSPPSSPPMERVPPIECVLSTTPSIGMTTIGSSTPCWIPLWYRLNKLQGLPLP
jgi:hypothetical protein